MAPTNDLTSGVYLLHCALQHKNTAQQVGSVLAKLLKFISIRQKRPAVSAPELRAKDFQEIYARFDPAAAAEQASRCSQCGIPFCQVHCPLQNNIPDWLMLTAEGRLEEAYAISSATNNFPEICGRICPQDKLCEGNCVIENGFESVTIGQVEKYITDTAFDKGWVKPIRVTQENGKSVGIIGAGPAGLAAAEQLRRKGYAVHVYDRYDRVGGLMIYGIPNFKLDKAIVQRREALLRDGGIAFHLNCAVGDDVTVAQLRAKHDAVLVATGVYQARGLNFPHEQADNLVPALDYLTASNRIGLGDVVAGYDSGALNAKKKRVVVIGGGDTAMDCVRTAIRQQAKSVTCLYRRDRENMPGSAREVKNAEEEGVQFKWLSAPKAFKVSKGRISEVLVEQMRLGAPDASGRLQPIAVPDAGFSLDADLVITALGFEPEELPVMFKEPQLSLTRYGTLQVDRQMMTSLPGVFAAGDIVRGASLVVWAIRDGRDVAEAMDRYISASAATTERKVAHV